MLFQINVLIARTSSSLDHPFTYLTEDERIKKGMRVILPFNGNKVTIAFTVSDPKKLDCSKEEFEKQMGFKVNYITKPIDPYPLLNDDSLFLATTISYYYKTDLMKVIQTMLPPSLKPKKNSKENNGPRTIDYVTSIDDVDTSSLSKNELNLYKKCLKKLIKRSEITAKSSLDKLIEKKYIVVKSVKPSYVPEIVEQNSVKYDLTSSQQHVFDCVVNGDEKTYLLQGVTGSGKTEVYIRLAQYYLKQGKGTIILMPEMALTDRMSSLFYNNFKDTLSLLYSSLPARRKQEEYERILNNESRVVLGTRSAIFSPVSNLGLIIIDEEHSSSYKNDNMPCYDAIKVAQMLSTLHGCKVLLASATCRVQDMAIAKKGTYKLLTMNERIAKETKVEKEIIDMNDLMNLDLRKSSLISLPLINEINDVLNNNQQVMLLLNRRGHSTTYLCDRCHKVLKCPNCGLPLVYHEKNADLECHHCGYCKSIDQVYCECGSREFKPLGYGTEKIEDEAKIIFPNARVLMLDSDVSSNNLRQEQLEMFSKRQYDILIGTQVISKGFDFPFVTLAAILDADSPLSMPSYRASEDAFSLISQFIGRTGRGKFTSKAVVQTYNPSNVIIKMALNQDYDSFYNYEIEQRKKYKYPPFVCMSTITIKGLDKKIVDIQSIKIKNFILKYIANKRFDCIGPYSPFISYMNGYYYKCISIKYKVVNECMELLDKIRALKTFNEDVILTYDIDTKI